MKNTLLTLAVATIVPGLSGAIDYKKDVLPIMKEYCWECHSSDNKVKGNLDLKNLDEMRESQVGKFNIIRPGDPEESTFLNHMKLDESASDFMPRNGKRLPDRKLATIEKWIKDGAVIDRENLGEKEKEWAQKSSNDSSTTKSGMAQPANFVVWKSSDGRELEASFLGLGSAKTSVKLLRKKDRISFEIPFANLSPESVELAQQMAEEEK